MEHILKKLSYKLYIVGPRPLEGRGVLYTSGGWGGVGWGGACNNVHVNLRRRDMLVCGCR